MIKIFVVRHGDSPFTAATDHQRPLSQKGINQAQKSARFIASHCTQQPTLIICSDAQRTKSTAEVIQQTLNCQLVSDHKFYQAQTGHWCDVIINNPNIKQLILVGHNPTVSLLSQHLCQIQRFHFNPACVAFFNLEIADDGLRLPAHLNAFYSPDANQ